LTKASVGVPSAVADLSLLYLIGGVPVTPPIAVMDRGKREGEAFRDQGSQVRSLFRL